MNLKQLRHATFTPLHPQWISRLVSIR